MSSVEALRSFVARVCLILVAWTVPGLAQGGPPERGEYVVYSCRYKPATDIEKLLRGLLPEEDGLHLVVDTKSNALLLRGSASAQRIAAGLLARVDRPGRWVTPSAADAPVVRSHDFPPDQLDRWVEIVRSRFRSRSDVKVTSSRDTGQLFILAPPAVQETIERLVETGVTGPTVGVADTVPPAGTSRTAGSFTPSLRRLPAAASSGGSEKTYAAAQVDRVLHLRSTGAARMEQQLLALFGRRLRRMRRDDHDVFLLPIDDERSLEFQLDASRNIVLARGPEPIVQQFSVLVDALDSGSQRGRKTQALHVERTAPSNLRKAVDAYRGQAPVRSPGSRPASTDQSRTMPRRSDRGLRMVNYLFRGQSPDGPPPSPAPSGELGTVVPNVTGLNQLEVQTLPDLDVIILRGRDQDVEQLTKIIRELERLSAETKPKVYIYPLKYTKGESINEIIDQVLGDLVGGRQGRVTITPLEKPNSLLLIGWGEAVDTIINLIVKLDRPVPPESQFSIFQLKHAAVSVVQQTIQDFLGDRPGLGPKIQTASDARTNSLIVYAAPRDMAEVSRLIQQLDVPKSGAINRARIFRVYNALATDLADTLQQAITAAQSGQSGRSAVLELMAVDDAGQRILRSGMLDEVNITPNPRNNTLIVTGPPDTMGLIEALITQLDTPGDRAQIKVFRIINGDASNLVSMLRSLMPSQVGETLGPQIPSAPEEESLAPLRFSVEVRSNSIIAVGSEGDLRIVEALITRLDESESMNRRNAVYLLKNSPAIDVATSINEYLSSQRQLEAAEPGQSNPFQDLEREVIVVPEPVGNRLIVSATPRYFDEITQLIEKLDEPPPQVVIQALIAEVTLGDTDELGFELGLQDSVLFDRSLLGDLLTTVNSAQVSDPSGILTSTQEIIQAASLTPGFAFNNTDLGNSGSTQSVATGNNLGGQALSHFDMGRTSSDAGYGGLVLSASSQNVSVLIRALQENRQLRILSRPLIRTLDNQPAYIQVGQRVPRIVGSTVNTNGQSNSVTLENVGLILGVTPRISPDGKVVMEVDAEKSKVGPEEEGIPVSVSRDGTIIRSPRVDTVTAQATVSVGDSETVVMGGMISTEKEVIERKAPYLADIPVVGQLFRFDSSQERRTEMLIILTPRVIRNPEDAERIKQAEFARMNWCVADVYDIYGDIGMEFQSGTALPPSDGQQTQIVYPDVNPRGTPTPARRAGDPETGPGAATSGAPDAVARAEPLHSSQVRPQPNPSGPMTRQAQLPQRPDHRAPAADGNSGAIPVIEPPMAPAPAASPQNNLRPLDSRPRPANAWDAPTHSSGDNGPAQPR